MDYAGELDLERRRYSQERDDGYYAYHYYVKFRVRIVDKSWHESESSMEAEIQATTQLQRYLESSLISFMKGTASFLEKIRRNGNGILHLIDSGSDI